MGANAYSEQNRGTRLTQQTGPNRRNPTDGFDLTCPSCCFWGRVTLAAATSACLDTTYWQRIPLLRPSGQQILAL